MKLKALALQLDAQNVYPIETTDAYEEVVNSGMADLDTYVNLIVLYFVCQDGGFLVAHSLPTEFLNRAWVRTLELIEEAESRFNRPTEVSFWKRFIQFILLGQPFPTEECRQLALSGQSRVPYLYLYAFSDGKRESYRSNALELLEQVDKGQTAKERYIRSVLRAALRD